jgi:transposase
VAGRLFDDSNWMTKSDLSLLTRAKIVFKRDENLSWPEVAKACDCSIHQARYWYSHRDDISDHPHTGRPKSISPETQSQITEQFHDFPHSTLREAAKKYPASPESVRSIVLKAGFKWLDPIEAVPLSSAQRQYRVEFATNMQKYPLRNPIVFSDESMIVANPDTQKIWRIPGEIRDDYIAEIKAHPYQRMVWAAIGLGFKSDLILITGHVNSQYYVKMLLDHNVFDNLSNFYGPGNYFFQEDNASSHISQYTSKWFSIMHIPRLPFKWPAKSPDLSPIEHVWDLLKRTTKLDNIKSEEDLDSAILKSWGKITIDQINQFVTSFPYRLQTCVNLEGKSLNGHWREVGKLHHPSVESK